MTNDAYDTDPETEEIEVTVKWESTHRVTVPKGWRPTDRLEDFPAGALDEITSDTATIIDWR